MIAIARAAFNNEYNAWTITRNPKLTAFNATQPAIYYTTRMTPSESYSTDSENCPMVDYNEFRSNKDATEFIADQSWAAALRAVAPLIKENRPIG